MLTRFLFSLFCCLLFVFPGQAFGKQPKKKKTCAHQLAICTIFQNEAPYLAEWIEYHLLVGVDHFFLFNNESTDHYREVLEPYVKKHIVDLYDWPGEAKNQLAMTKLQCAAYKQALTLANSSVKWLAIIDADEFIVPLQEKSVPSVLSKYEKFGGVYLNWLCFGTSHIEKIPPGQWMIECLNHCAKEPSQLGKSIVRPERVADCTDPHRMWYHFPYFHVNTDKKNFDWDCPLAKDKLLLFHYYTRDLDHLIHVKFPRRKRWIGIELDSYIQEQEPLNAAQNHTMQRFLPTLKSHQ